MYKNQRKVIILVFSCSIPCPFKILSSTQRALKYKLVIELNYCMVYKIKNYCNMQINTKHRC